MRKQNEHEYESHRKANISKDNAGQSSGGVCNNERLYDILTYVIGVYYSWHLFNICCLSGIGLSFSYSILTKILKLGNKSYEFRLWRHFSEIKA